MIGGQLFQHIFC